MNELTHIFNVCCEVAGVKPEIAKKRCRNRNLIIARFLFFTIAYTKGYVYQEIGDFVGKKHTTVLHGVKKVKDFISINDKMYPGLIKNAEDRLKDNDLILERLKNEIKILNDENLDKLSNHILEMLELKAI